MWLAAHFRREGRWDQSYLYSLDAKIHRWLLRSPYRTLDPNEADYFFIPAYLSLGFYDFEFGLYWLTTRGHVFLRQLLTHVAHSAPWFNKTDGADHVMVMTNDKGATFIRNSVPMLRRVNLITQWGWKRPHIHQCVCKRRSRPLGHLLGLAPASPLCFLLSASGRLRPPPHLCPFCLCPCCLCPCCLCLCCLPCLPCHCRSPGA